MKVIKIWDVRQKKRKSIRKKKAAAIVGFSSVLVIGVSSLLFEFYLIPKGLYSLVGNLGFELAVLAIGMLFNRKDIMESGEFDASWAERILSIGKAFIKEWKRFDFLRFILWIGFCVLIGQVIGNRGWISDTSRACQAAIYVFQNEEVEVLSDSETQRSEYISVLSGKDEKTLQQIKNLTISQNEKNRKMSSSSEDHAAACFEGGEYNILGQEDQNEVNKIIEGFVEELRGKKRENIFDKPEEEGGAPESVKGRISEASEKEKEVKSFGEAEEILVDREDVYLIHKKASLAKLIANGYELLALTLLFYEGNVDTINYYYEQSILKDFEYLEYDGLSNTNIKSRLLKIVQKYKDMKLINPDWETKFPTIEKLSNAFQYVADQY